MNEVELFELMKEIDPETKRVPIGIMRLVVKLEERIRAENEPTAEHGAPEHILSMDCWCKPVRDAEEPSVVAHNKARPMGWLIEDYTMLRYTSDESSARGYAKIGRAVRVITATEPADFS